MAAPHGTGDAKVREDPDLADRPVCVTAAEEQHALPALPYLPPLPRWIDLATSISASYSLLVFS